MTPIAAALMIHLLAGAATGGEDLGDLPVAQHRPEHDGRQQGNPSIESVIASTAVVPLARPTTRRCAISARAPTSAQHHRQLASPPSVATPTMSSSTKLKSTTTALR